jgi:hypothetical protein
MGNFFSNHEKKVSLPAFIGITLYAIIFGTLLATNPSSQDKFLASSMFQQVFAQDHFGNKTIATATTVTAGAIDGPLVTNSLSKDAIANNQQSVDHNTVMASGHFANNQIKDGMVTWIQGGYWDLQIQNNTGDTGKINNGSDNQPYQANFRANFTMIRPDGSLSHNHVINNFSSDNVIFAGNDIVITGVADIGSDYGLEYDKVPLIVHLMGKRVLGLTIDTSKTKGHFESSNEMFGTLISGVGINTATVATSNANTTIPLAESNSPKTLGEQNSNTNVTPTMTHHH